MSLKRTAAETFKTLSYYDLADSALDLVISVIVWTARDDRSRDRGTQTGWERFKAVFPRVHQGGEILESFNKVFCFIRFPHRLLLVSLSQEQHVLIMPCFPGLWLYIQHKQRETSQSSFGYIVRSESATIAQQLNFQATGSHYVEARMDLHLVLFKLHFCNRPAGYYCRYVCFVYVCMY